LNGALLVVALQLPTAHEERHAGAPAPAVLPLLRQPAVAWFLASVFFTVLAHTSLYAFFSLFLVHGGFGKQAVGLLWAVSVAMEILFFRLQGRWFSRLSPHAWLAVAAGATVLRFAAMAIGGAQAWLLVLAQVTHAVTFAAHHAACIAVVSRHFPGRLRGRGQALYSALGYGLSGLLGGIGGGWLVEHHGFPALYGAAALAGLLALGCVQRAWRAEQRADTPAPGGG
jgi:PPP family 3-phenylpropionic acid transporter